MPIKIGETTYKLPGDSGERSLTMGEQNLIERHAKRPLEKVFAPVNISAKARKSPWNVWDLTEQEFELLLQATKSE